MDAKAEQPIPTRHEGAPNDGGMKRLNALCVQMSRAAVRQSLSQRLLRLRHPWHDHQRSLTARVPRRNEMSLIVK